MDQEKTPSDSFVSTSLMKSIVRRTVSSVSPGNPTTKQLEQLIPAANTLRTTSSYSSGSALLFMLRRTCGSADSRPSWTSMQPDRRSNVTSALSSVLARMKLIQRSGVPSSTRRCETAFRSSLPSLKIVVHEPHVTSATACRILHLCDELIDRLHEREPAILHEIAERTLVGAAVARLHGHDA